MSRAESAGTAEKTAGCNQLDVEILRAALDDARKGLVEAMGYVHGHSQGFSVDPAAWVSALGMIAHSLDIVAVEVDVQARARRREERPIVNLAERLDRAGSRKPRRRRS